MTRVVFAIPGDLQARTGGYGYDRRLLAALPRLGIEAAHCALPGGFPQPSEADAREGVAALRAKLRPGDVALIDGLAFGAMPEAAIRAIGAPIVALCHHPLCLETGLTRERSDALRDSEGRALALAAHAIVTSPHTAALLTQQFGVPREKISVAVPGTDPVPRARGSGGAPALLAVGSIIPRKAFDLLVEALGDLADLDWRLRIVGGAMHSPATSRALDSLIGAKNLSSRIERLGELGTEPLGGLFDASDVFVSSSLYEGFGMALAEALARGLPIVTTTGGAAAETIPDAAALKVAPGDVGALREALRRVIADAALRAELADASWRAGQELPRWEETARIVAEIVCRISEAAR